MGTYTNSNKKDAKQKKKVLPIKKISSLILIACMLFTITEANNIISAQELPLKSEANTTKGNGLADETQLLLKNGFINDAPSAETETLLDKKELEDIQSILFSNQENKYTKDTENDNTLDNITAYQKRFASFAAQDIDNTNAETVSLYAVSYYSGTTIPTYTYVTGRKLYDSYESDDGKTVGYTYICDLDEHFYYIEYLMDYCGWEFYTDTTASDESYATIYLVKDSSLLSITANFRYGLTTILFAKPVSTVPATSISLNTTNRLMIVENIYTLEATVLPSNTTDKSITWSSSNTSVASITSNGVVTAKAAGTTTITAKTSNGKKATCTITVKNQVLESYPNTIIPTFTCITGKPLAGYEVQEEFIIYAYALDIESHTDYEAYLARNGWVLEYENVADDSSYYSSGYAKGDTRVLVMADFQYNTTIISYEDKSISVTSSINGNKIVVTPKNLPKDSSIILACYHGKELTDMQFYTYNNETSITFSMTKNYNKIKIFLWKSPITLIPLCVREIVPLS